MNPNELVLCTTRDALEESGHFQGFLPSQAKTVSTSCSPEKT